MSHILEEKTNHCNTSNSDVFYYLTFNFTNMKVKVWHKIFKKENKRQKTSDYETKERLFLNKIFNKIQNHVLQNL